MDPITTIVVSTAVNVVTDAARKDAVEFLRKVFRQGLGQVREVVGEQLTQWREGNTITTIFGASQRLKDVGVTPRTVAGNVLLPLLEGASIEDRPELKVLWENLLANAADPRENLEVSPTFIGILRELTPRLARFVEVLYVDGGTAINQFGHRVRVPFMAKNAVADAYRRGNGTSIDRNSAITDGEIDYAIEILTHHGLLSLVNAAQETLRDPSAPSADATTDYFRLTNLGFLFFKAVSPPAASPAA
ncbi:MAG TPA: Abi-alpha family protein [Terriglobales bacterium]|jgi:hypothetical protein